MNPPWWAGKMYRPELTPFSITSRWLSITEGGCGESEGFEVATWVDSDRARQAAKVVIGPTGCEKNAWGPALPFNSVRSDLLGPCCDYLNRLY